VATARHADRVVGAATGIPLAAAGPELVAPVRGAGYRVEGLYYVGELLFYQEFRSRGLGVELLQRVAEQVRGFDGYRYLCCATVQRPADHPARPEGYLPIEGFLGRTGFKALGDLVTDFRWRELDGVERNHPMKYWIKDID